MTRVNEWGWTERRAHGYIVIVAEPSEHIDRIWSRANRTTFAGLATLIIAVATALICFLLRVPAPQVWAVLAAASFTATLIALLTTGALRGADPDIWAYIPDQDRDERQQRIHELVAQLEAGDGDLYGSHQALLRTMLTR